MRPVEQRHADDCWNACIASLFELPYDEVADMPRGSDDTWRRRWTEWFAERGYAFGERYLNLGENGRWVGYGELTIACGPSPRREGRDHCVIARDGEIVWDPHPDREHPIAKITSVIEFLPLDPSRMVLREAVLA